MSASWNTGNRLAIGDRLARSATPLTAAELAAQLGQDSSNTRAALKRLIAAGLVEETQVTRPTGRGRPPRCAYALSDEGAANLPRTAATPGLLREGSHVVFAEASPREVPELAHILSTGVTATRIAWTFGAIGEGAARGLVFDGPNASQDAGDVIAELAAAHIGCRHVLVSEVASAAETRSTAARRAQIATRSQMRANTRRVAG